MKRWGGDARFRDLIFRIRESCPGAVFRSNFIVGYPEKQEEDHDQLIDFIQEMRLDWCGFFLLVMNNTPTLQILMGKLTDR